MFKFLLGLSMLFLSVVQPVYANKADKCQKYNTDDLMGEKSWYIGLQRDSAKMRKAQKKIDCLKYLAEQGNADAQYRWGRVIEWGYDQPKVAFSWYLGAAQNGSQMAIRRVANIYSNKTENAFQYGIQKDLSKGLQFYLLLDSYSGRDCIALGHIYLDSVKHKNVEKAIFYYKKAILDTPLSHHIDIFADAYYNLAKLYIKGDVVKQNRVLAYVLLRKADFMATDFLKLMSGNISSLPTFIFEMSSIQENIKQLLPVLENTLTPEQKLEALSMDIKEELRKN